MCLAVVCVEDRLSQIQSHLKICHIRGQDNIIANALSRAV